MVELFITLLALNVMFALGAFIFSLMILNKMKNHSDQCKCLFESTPQMEHRIETRPLIVPPLRRKPVVMDDARAYQIEQKELESRKRE